MNQLPSAGPDPKQLPDERTHRPEGPGDTGDHPERDESGRPTAPSPDGGRDDRDDGKGSREGEIEHADRARRGVVQRDFDDEPTARKA
jgi:hypothetical protein